MACCGSVADVRNMSVDNLYEYLMDVFDEDTVALETIEKFLANRIKGEYYLELTNDDLISIVPKLGERKAIQKHIGSLKPAVS